MMFSVIMAMALFKSSVAAEIAADVSKDDVLIQCLYALLRVVLLVATFVLGQRALNANRGQKKLRNSPSISRSTPRAANSHGRYATSPNLPQNVFKRSKMQVVCDDQDDVSTSAGSSDSDSDALSSDNEGARGKSPKISIGDLLRSRPAVGPVPAGSLHTMSVVEHAPPSRQQFEERRWENLRNASASGESAVCKPAKAVPTKQSSKKTDAKPQKAPRAAVAQVPVDAATAAANSARMAALLEIICPEDTMPPTDPKTSTAKSGALPPWRKQFSVNLA